MVRIVAALSISLFVATAFAGDAEPVPAPERIRDLVTIAGAAPKALAAHAKSSLEEVADKEKVVPLMRVLEKAPERLRKYAVEELSRIGDLRALPILLHRSLAEPSRRVREAALKGARKMDEAGVIRYYVHRFEAHGGGAHRSYVQVGTQLSYLKDYDVEVSATAFIADPIVGTMSEGQVLDVKVSATSRSGVQVTRHRLHSALRAVTGATGVPNRRGAWAEWLRKREARAK